MGVFRQLSGEYGNSRFFVGINICNLTVLEMHCLTPSIDFHKRVRSLCFQLVEIGNQFQISEAFLKYRLPSHLVSKDRGGGTGQKKPHPVCA